MVYSFHRKHLFLIILLFICTGSINAQKDDSSILFRNYDLQNGLINDTVLEIHQDGQGFIWLHTQGGMIRYDGRHFEQFRIHHEEQDLTRKILDSILMDYSGVPWLGLRSEGLVARFNANKREFEVLDLSVILPEEAESGRTEPIAVTKAGVYFKLHHNGSNSPNLVLWNSNLDKPQVVKEQEDVFSLNSVMLHRILWRTFEYPIQVSQNNLWVGEIGSLAKITNSEAIRIPLPSEIQQDTIRSITTYDEHSLVLATSSAVLKYDIESAEFRRMEIPSELEQADPVYRLYKDQSDGVWLSTYGQTWRYHDGVFSSISDRPEFSETPHLFLTPKAEHDGKIWMINEFVLDSPTMFTNGISVFDTATETITVWNRSDDNLLAAERINDVTISHDGAVLIGYNNAGLQIYTPKNKRFDTYFTNPEHFTSGANAYLMNAAISPDGLLLAGSFEGRILAANRESGLERNWGLLLGGYEYNLVRDWYFPSPGRALVISLESFYELLYDAETLQLVSVREIPSSNWGGGSLYEFLSIEEGKITVSSNQGIVRFSEDLTNFEKLTSEQDGIPKEVVNELGAYHMLDNHGRYWFAWSFGSGIQQYNPQTETITVFNANRGSDYFIHGVDNLVQLSDGSIIAIGFTSLYLFDENRQKFIPWEIDIEVISAPSITTFQDMIVFGSSYDGVYFLNLNGEVKNHFSMQNELPTDLVSDVLVINDELWVMHRRGLSHKKSDGTWRHYQGYHGLPALQQQRHGRFKRLRDGWVAPLWQGEGVSLFQPERMLEDSKILSPKIVKVEALFEDNIEIYGNNLRIGHHQRDIRILLAALDFNDPLGAQFRYRLSGEQWSEWSDNPELRFFQLAPGSHQIEVSLRNADGIEAASFAELNIIVMPPWYQTTWARILAGLLFLALVGFVARYYVSYRTRQESLLLQAEQAEKLARLDTLKNQLILNISHELRTPLSLVLAPIEQMIRKNQPVGADMNHLLDIARRNGKRLHQLVEQVLDLARLEMGDTQFQVEPVSISKTSKRIFDYFESLAEQQKINMIFEGLTEDTNLYLDLDKFEKIMINLIGNAIKFTPAEGAVSIRLEQSNDEVILSVADTGRGIPPERISGIFKRFETTAEADAQGSKGLGIGLSITREYVRLHKADISVASELGKGTKFTLRIKKGSAHFDEKQIIEPKEPGVVVEEEYRSEAQQVEQSESRVTVSEDAPLVLIIEDNVDLRDFIANIFSETYRVEVAENGREGIAKLEAVAPDLVITDIMMPEIDGFGVLSHIRQSEPHRFTPVIILSARAEMEDRIRGFEIGVNDYLAKPFSTEELVVRAENLLELRSNRQEAREEYEEDSTDSEVVEDAFLTGMVESLETYVRERLSQSEITAEELAALVVQSRSTLYRNLKIATGYTPAQFVREIRLLEAQKIFHNEPRALISDVSQRVGFSNASYFSRLYKKKFGLRPKSG